MNPVQITGFSKVGDTTLYNESQTTIYVGEYPNRNGFPLTAGMTLTWQGGKDLYAYMDAPGTVAILDVVDNGGMISSPAAIAQQLIASGLATDIAQDILATGIVAIDVPVVLYTHTDTTSNIGSPDIDISRYNSVVVQISESDVNTPTPAAATTRQVFCHFFAPTVAGYPAEMKRVAGTYLGGGSTSGGSQWIAELPALGSLLAVSVIGDDSAMGAVATTLQVLGSYRTLTKPAILTDNYYGITETLAGTLAGFADGNLITFLKTNMIANEVATAHPQTKSGPAVLCGSISTATPAAGFDITVTDLKTGGVILSRRSYINANPSDFAIALDMPNGAVEIKVVNKSAAPWVGSMTLALQYTD